MENVSNKEKDTQDIKQVIFSPAELEVVVEKVINKLHNVLSIEVDKRVNKKIRRIISQIPQSIVMAVLASHDLDITVRKLIIGSINERESKFDGRIIEESVEEIGNEQ